jgi:hypothetical protein
MKVSTPSTSYKSNRDCEPILGAAPLVCKRAVFPQNREAMIRTIKGCEALIEFTVTEAQQNGRQ